jgi:uncharacterized membrane protein
VKTNRGVVLIILGVVGFYVVNGAQGMLATMGALQARAWVGLVGKVLCWAMLIGGIWAMRADKRRAEPPAQ